MKLRWLLFLFLLAAEAVAARTPVILVLGDSLSAAYGIDTRAAWVSLLQERLRQQGYPHTVVNASISGDTSAGGRARLDDALKRQRPDILILELGANDGLRGVALTETSANLAAIIKSAKTAGGRVLLAGIHIPPNYGPEYSKKFHAIYRNLARTHKVALVPFILQGVALNPELMQVDGLHPRAQAQPKILDNVWPHLLPLLKPFAPRRTPLPAGEGKG